MFTPRGAEVLTIGDELNRGEIVDTNSTWLAARLSELGLHVRWRSSTTDDPADLRAALEHAAGRAQVIIASGGLGPTDDDRTVDVVSGLLGVEPAIDEEHRQRMLARFAERGFTVTANNLRQVRVPAGAKALPNHVGLAPGFQARLAEAEAYFLPGVPREMKDIFERTIGPALVRLDEGRGATARRTWRVAGMGESHVDHRLRGLLDGVEGATLHFRIVYPENLVTVVVRRDTREAADRAIERLDDEVRNRLGGAVYGIDDDTLPSVIGRRLREHRETVALAESCTGGLVGDLLTDVPGASDYVLGGVVAYANRVKQSLLGVREETLAHHGAVSEACVREMADGARRLCGADWGVAVSGIAGPGGGSAEKPVGLVHFAVVGPQVSEARKLVWPHERRQVKQLAAFAALNLLDKMLAPERREPAGAKESR